ncbi:MAG: hypothetical protein V4721_06905 [Bacteroidota bacterium]
MKRLLTVLLLSGPLLSFACDCAPSNLSADNLRKQSYVALVRVKEQLPFEDEKYREYDANIPIQYDVLIEEIVLFKGDSRRQLTVSGAPPQSKTISTSCDIGVSAGQEWLVIVDSKPGDSVIVGACGYSMLYRGADGFRNWQYGTALKKLFFINSILPHPALAKLLDLEKPVLYYPNGQIERTVIYRNKKKEGTAMYYYPDGKIYGRAEYNKDSLNGKQAWYNRRGDIYSRATYRMGVPVDTMVYYMYPNAPMFLSIRSKEGVMQKFQEYRGDFSTRTSRLSQETLYTNDKRTSTTYYRENGTVSSVSKFHDLGTTELTYDESGNLIRTREFSP